nr:uncharacterized mitochondrial protein AtMg00810-like [Tanacetum cinerariifolium]
MWSFGSANPQNTDGDAPFNEKEPEFDEKKHESEVNVSPSSSAQSKKQDDKTKREAKGKSHVESFTGYRNLSTEFEDFSDNNINEVNAVELEDITYSDDEDDVGVEADFNNLETSITAYFTAVSPKVSAVWSDELVLLEGVECLPNEEIFTELARMGYKKPSTKLRSIIGSLMYLTSSRPDIMFAVCACAHFQVTPKASHLRTVKRIFRYLKGKPHLVLWYLKDSTFDLVAYLNSDYAGASLDRKSITRGCQFLGCRLIFWQCKKQTVVATSSTKAEYVVAASCYAQVL